MFTSKNYQNGISKWPDIKDDDQRCQVERRYRVSKTSVWFRYQLKLLCDVLSWSVSLMYQLIGRYDVSNWLDLFTHQSNRADKFTYELPRHNDVSAWSRKFKLVIKWANFFCVLCSELPRRLRWFSPFKVPAITLLQRLKDIGLIQVSVATSLRRVKLVSLT